MEAKVLFSLFLFLFRPLVKQENGSSSHLDFSTKLMLITALSFTTTPRLHSFKFTLFKNAVHSTACRWVGRHFLNFYACHMQSRSQTKDHGHCSGNKTSAHTKLHVFTMYLCAQLVWFYSGGCGKGSWTPRRLQGAFSCLLIAILKDTGLL